MRSFVVLLAFGACSHPSASSTSTSTQTSTSTASATTGATTCRPMEIAAACPPNPAGAECDGKTPFCTFADTQCHCDFEEVGGAPPRGPMTWQCAVTVRPDGCPGLGPFAGTCCSGPDHDCGYPAGNNGPYVAACRRGAWVEVKRPPAMP